MDLTETMIFIPCIYVYLELTQILYKNLDNGDSSKIKCAAANH